MQVCDVLGNGSGGFVRACQGNLLDTLMGTHYLHFSGVITHIYWGLKTFIFFGFLGFKGDL